MSKYNEQGYFNKNIANIFCSIDLAYANQTGLQYYDNADYYFNIADNNSEVNLCRLYFAETFNYLMLDMPIEYTVIENESAYKEEQKVLQNLKFFYDK